MVTLYRELPIKAVMTTRTKMELWLDMMRTSGMVPEDEAGKDRLFVTLFRVASISGNWPGFLAVTVVVHYAGL